MDAKEKRLVLEFLVAGGLRPMQARGRIHQLPESEYARLVAGATNWRQTIERNASDMFLNSALLVPQRRAQSRLVH